MANEVMRFIGEVLSIERLVLEKALHLIDISEAITSLISLAHLLFVQQHAKNRNHQIYILLFFFKEIMHT